MKSVLNEIASDYFEKMTLSSNVTRWPALIGPVAPFFFSWPWMHNEITDRVKRHDINSLTDKYSMLRKIRGDVWHPRTATWRASTFSFASDRTSTTSYSSVNYSLRFVAITFVSIVSLTRFSNVRAVEIREPREWKWKKEIIENWSVINIDLIRNEYVCVL